MMWERLTESPLPNQNKFTLKDSYTPGLQKVLIQKNGLQSQKILNGKAS